MKKILAVLLAAALALSCAACGGEKENEQKEETSQSGDTVSSASAASEENSAAASESGDASYSPDDAESILSSISAETDAAIRLIDEDAASLLEALGDSYDTYDANCASVPDFYSGTQKRAEELYSAY